MRYIAIIAFCFLSFDTQKEVKKLKVEFTIEEWNLIYDCLDKSTASHAQVKQAFDMLNKQIVPQIGTTKKK